MPQLRRNRLRRPLTLTRSHMEQLACGHDFLHIAFGNDVEAMRTAWSDPAVRSTVRAMRRERFGTQRQALFGDLAFGPECEGGMVKSESDLGAAQVELSGIYRREEQEARRCRPDA